MTARCGACGLVEHPTRRIWPPGEEEPREVVYCPCGVDAPLDVTLRNLIERVGRLEARLGDGEPR